MARLSAFAAAVLLLALAGLTPLWLDLGRGRSSDALVPIAIAVLHAMVMLGVAQWVLSGMTRAVVVPRPPDYPTTARAMLGSVCLAVVVAAASAHVVLPSWWLAAVAVPALILDAVDGWVARRTGTGTAAGARFDLECDAMFMIIISAGAALVYGPWVLAHGLLRYAFVLAGLVLPRLRRPLAFSQLRRVIAAGQGVVVVVSVIPLLPYRVDVGLLALALTAVVGSFGRDVVRLLRAV